MKHRRKIITTGAIWSEKLASVDHAAERLYWRIYMATDNYGVMSGKPWDVMQQATPGVSGFTRASVSKAIDALVDAGLLERWEERDGSTFVFVVGHDKHQNADFIRKRGVRRSPLPPSVRTDGPNHNVPDELHIASDDAVPCPSRENGTEGHAMVALPTSTSTPTGSRDMSTSGKPTRDVASEARQVFDHWITVWGKRADTKFDGKRRANTIARLRSGYTVDDLCDAVSGYTLSEHHNGANGKKYDDLELFMRDSSKVDAGRDYHASRRGLQNTTPGASALSTADLNRIDAALRRARGRDLTTDEEAALQAGTLTTEALLANHGIVEAGAA